MNKLTYKEIADKTTIPKKRLDAALIALCKPGVQVLIKEIKKPVFESDAETVTLNIEFKNNAVRINLIPTGVAKLAPNEVAEQTTKENEDILPILFSMLNFSNDEINSVNKAREELNK